MKPVIGITVDYEPDTENARTGGKLRLNWNYAQTVADSGGIPILIPPQVDPEEVLPMLDGLLIPGGNDVDARHWGEENHPSVVPIADERFDLESRLLQAADPDLPVLGICYGCQLINVQRGGSLIQHLPDILGHEEHTGGKLDEYEVDSSSKLASAVGSKISGQSWHHQAIGKTGSGLKVVAQSADGTVEAIEAEDRPWLVGVQWHPERTAQDPGSKRLFDDFIAAATRFKGQRSP